MNVLVGLSGCLYFPIMSKSPEDVPLIPTQAELYFVYQTVASRRVAYDSMMWQTPALGLTAQAFLLTLALEATSRSLVRFIAASLSFVLSFITMQLMAKHRSFEVIDSKMLARFENKLGISDWLEVHPHGPKECRKHESDIVTAHGKSLPKALHWFRWFAKGPRWFWGKSSFLVWQFGLASFGLISIGIMIVVITGHSDSLFNQR